MNLGELLDELRNGVLHDSSSLKTGPSDRYWTDGQLIGYIDDAHKRFARLSLCIHDDTTPEVCEIELEDGVDIYPLHRSILSVLSAKHADDGQDLVRISHPEGQSFSNSFTEDFAFASYPSAGKPRTFSTDEGFDPTTNLSIRIRFFGMPNLEQDGKIVRLRTIRVPLKALTKDDMEAAHEIPAEYELDMLEWAAWRALRNWDIDSEDRSKADQHRKRFEESVIECRRDVLRKRWQGLRWQFGQSGWSGYVHN